RSRGPASECDARRRARSARRRRGGWGLAPACVVAPARLAAAGGREQQAEREAESDAERHHGFRMAADLLAHHAVELGGAVLGAGDGVTCILGGAVIRVRCLAFRLLIDALGL